MQLSRQMNMFRLLVFVASTLYHPNSMFLTCKGLLRQYSPEQAVRTKVPTTTFNIDEIQRHVNNCMFSLYFNMSSYMQLW